MARVERMDLAAEAKRSDGPAQPDRPARFDRPVRPPRAEKTEVAERPSGGRGNRAPTPRVPKKKVQVPKPPKAPSAAASAKAAPPGRAPKEPMRIQRALARAGVTSRREADTMVAEGRVTVNGEVARIGQVVDPRRDAIVFDGVTVGAPVAAEWFVLNKPSGYVTTRKDPDGRPTIFELVPDRPGLTYVGRLDLMTEGVLLLTTDGEAAHVLTHPSSEVERTYVAIVRGNAAKAVREARQGVELEDGMVNPSHVEARPAGNRKWEFEITIAEGRTREIRRLCEALGLDVERLVRVQFGPVKIGQLPSGESRALTVGERRLIDAVVGASHQGETI
jgi:23S rRNA pseudouridine2605 synthase